MDRSAGGNGSTASEAASGAAVHFVAEAYAHYKPIAALGEGAEVLKRGHGDPSAPGVTGEMGGRAYVDAFVAAMKKHRHFTRDVEMTPA